jgi:hypothetical protein
MFKELLNTAQKDIVRYYIEKGEVQLVECMGCDGTGGPGLNCARCRGKGKVQ